MSTTCSINSSTGEFSMLNKLLVTNAVSIIIPILTKLFATNMVARSFSGLSRFLLTRSLVLLLRFSFCFSVGVSEKYATSEPLISAEDNNNSTTIKRDTAMPNVKG
jgi:hypothetical protein